MKISRVQVQQALRHSSLFGGGKIFSLPPLLLPCVTHTLFHVCKHLLVEFDEAISAHRTSASLLGHRLLPLLTVRLRLHDFVVLGMWLDARGLLVCSCTEDNSSCLLALARVVTASALFTAISPAPDSSLSVLGSISNN